MPFSVLCESLNGMDILSQAKKMKNKLHSSCGGLWNEAERENCIIKECAVLWLDSLHRNS